MAEFSYKGVDNIGGSVNGLIEAVDRRGAIAQLAQRGHFATELFERAGGGKIAATETESISNKFAGILSPMN